MPEMEVKTAATGKFSITAARDHIKALVRGDVAYDGKLPTKIMSVKGSTTQNATQPKTIKTGQQVFYPFWDKAIKASYKGKVDYVEVPIAISKRQIRLYQFKQDNIKQKPDASVAKAAFQRLIIYKDKNGQIGQRLLTYIPDKQYIIEHGNSAGTNSLQRLQPNFFGYIEYKNWSGKIVAVLRIENGKVARRYKLSNVNEEQLQISKQQNTKPTANGKLSAVGPATSSTLEEICDWVFVPTFELVCEVIDDGNPNDENLNEIVCTLEEVGEHPEWVCTWVEVPDPEPCPWGNCDEEPCTDCGNPCIDCEVPGSSGENARDSLKKIMKDTCLNATQVENLVQTLSDYLNGQQDADLACVQKAIYNTVLAAGKKFGFCIDANIIGNGAYNATTGNLFWKDESGIPNVGLFGHEFFHGYQDSYYSGGTAQYNMGTRTGFPNIEFEQALFYDIVNGSATGMGSGVPSSIFNEYEAWIGSITDNYTKYPKQFSDFGTGNNNINKYYHFLGLFYQYSAYANMGTVHNNLQPNALLNIFNTSNCK